MLGFEGSGRRADQLVGSAHLLYAPIHSYIIHASKLICFLRPGRRADQLFPNLKIAVLNECLWGPGRRADQLSNYPKSGVVTQQKSGPGRRAT